MTKPKLIYLPMIQCIFGKLDVIFRDSPDFAVKMFCGVTSIADYKNKNKKFQKKSITWSKQELFDFLVWSSTFNDFLKNVGYLLQYRFFTEHTSEPLLSRKIIGKTRTRWRGVFFCTLL